jgi:hypothetical protein
VINSEGNASGDAGAQFAALGLAGVPADFRYAMLSPSMHSIQDPSFSTHLKTGRISR